MISKLAKKRLGILLKKMRTVPPKQFDMSRWQEISSCGMKACMGGWACSIPSFQKAGLRLVLDEERSLSVTKDRNKFTTVNKVKYKNKVEFQAIARFFDISFQDASELFASSHDPKGVVIKSLERYIKENG